jgi:uncharacterized protein (TIGR02145 family)
VRRGGGVILFDFDFDFYYSFTFFREGYGMKSINFWAVCRMVVLSAVLSLGLMGCGKDSSTTPTPKYSVTISSEGTGPAGGGNYKEGDRVFISAGKPPHGYTFYGWTAVSGDVNLGDAMSVATWFIMPASAVSLTANFRQSSSGSLPTYMVTVFSEGTGYTGTGIYTVGDTVYIYAGTPPLYGHFFEVWTTAGNGVVLDSVGSARTWFIMPPNSVSVTARFVNFVNIPGLGNWGPLSCGNRECETVVINGKKWMAENLNRMPDSGNSWCYGNMADNCADYGRLYDWNAAQTVCPTGWHLPTRREWGDLAIFTGGTTSEPGFGGVDYGTNNPAGTALKSTTGWANAGHQGFCADTPEISCGNGTDAHGFSARPGGIRYPDGSFGNIGYGGYWWTFTTGVGDYPYIREMRFNSQSFTESYSFSDNYGYSVRCVKDD